MLTAPAFPTTATNKGYAKGAEMGCPAEDLDVVPGRELMDEAGRHLAFDIHSDARELRLAGVDVQGIHDADVETRDEAVAFLKAKGFSRGEADTLGPAVMAMLGWSKAWKGPHEFLECCMVESV